MERNKVIRLAFWVLVYGMAPVLFMGLISGQFRPESLGSMIFMGILAFVWVVLGNHGVRVAGEMV